MVFSSLVNGVKTIKPSEAIFIWMDISMKTPTPFFLLNHEVSRVSSHWECIANICDKFQFFDIYYLIIYDI